MPLFDVHAHLTHPRLFPDVDAVIDRARAAGVSTIISNGLNLADNEQVRQLAARRCEVLPAFGLYPVDAVLAEMRADGVDYPGRQDTADANEAIQWVRRHAHEAIAIGEVGLDAHWVPERFLALQEQRFRMLVEVAMAADRPLIIHSRKRERLCFDILREMGASRVNWHCYSSKSKLARQIAEFGHHLSVPANAERAEGFSPMLSGLPREQLLLETDAPYLSPTPGTINEPANVTHTCALAGRLWGVDPNQVMAQFSSNFETLFRVAPNELSVD